MRDGEAVGISPSTLGSVVPKSPAPTCPRHSPTPLDCGMGWERESGARKQPFPVPPRFFVNFEVGQGPGADVAFHFNPRFDGWDKVVFNSQQDGKWGNEEKKRSMPFRKGSAFELVIMVMPEHYKVVVNGDPFYEFGHRIPVQMVTHLKVDGDLTLQSINFIGGQCPGATQGPPASLTIHAFRPSVQGPGKHNQQPRMLGHHALFPQPVPFKGRLQGGLLARRTIVIKGYVPPTGKSFVINFKVGSSGDVALHINPRLTEGTVVRNAFLKGAWGPEERKISHNPFGPGQFFDLSIRCGMDRFKVYANGQHLFDFSHRLSAFQGVDTLEIQGDVTLSYVQI
uniref:Galectin n=1 Tax=Catagonus wagneri TaxID=51154 RepID=A0A8C3X414_9CETA